MTRFLRSIVVALLLCLTAGAAAQTTKWRDMYKVKKKDTIFGIARQYGISIPELMEANPEMKAEGYELKKGDYVFIPFTTQSDQSPQNNPNVQNSQNAQSTRKATSRIVRIGVMLPLHNVDGDGNRMVEYYRGLLMACDELKQQGVSTDIHAWNVNIDSDVSQALADPAAAQCDLIFGPLYTHQVRPLAEFCKARNIRLIIPFSINGDDVARYNQIFQVWESPDKLNNSAIESFIKRFGNAHPVFIDCNDKTSKKGVFTFALRNRLDTRSIRYSITNLNSSEELFAKAFSRTQPNVIVLNTDRSPELTVALSKLESLNLREPKIKMSLFGYTEWLMYADYNMAKYCMFDTYIPSYFYYNVAQSRTRTLEQSYRRWFHTDMQTALPRFAITGYDHAMFFVQGFAQKGKAFRGTPGESRYVPMQTPLRFKQIGTAGMQNEFFQLVHYTPKGNVESVVY